MDSATVRDLAKSQPKPGAESTAPQQRKRVVGRPFPKGVSGNPAGRPKGSVSVTDPMRRILSGDCPPEYRHLSAEALAIKALEMAANGDRAMLDSIIDRIDGKPRQGIDLAADEGALTLVWPASTLKSESPNGNGHNGNGNGNGPTNRIASADSGAGNGSH